jgi:hypothetical protein
MSGGYLDYSDWDIRNLADQIDNEIDRNRSTEKGEYGDDISQHFTENTMDKFREAVELLEKVSIMVNRIDYLLEGDDSEETFHELWDEGMRPWEKR